MTRACRRGTPLVRRNLVLTASLGSCRQQRSPLELFEYGSASVLRVPVNRRARRLRFKDLHGPNDETLIDLHDAVDRTVFRDHKRKTAWVEASE